MPTTINTSDLTIITRELITLGGNQYDSKHTQIIPNIKEVTKRLITVPTASIGSTDTNEGVEILKITPTLLTGPYKEADIRYIRITNLDDTNFVTLQFHNDQGNVSATKLDYGSTFFYNCDMASGSIDTIQASSNTIVNTDSTVDFNSGSAVVDCGANQFIRAGSSLSGSTHFPSGSFVSKILTASGEIKFDTDGQGATNSPAVIQFELNTPATLTGTNIETVFKIGLQDLDAIYAVADTENVDIEIFVASV